MCLKDRLTFLGWGLLALAWLLPNHYPPWTAFHSEAIAYAGLALLFVAVLQENGTANLRFPNVALCTATVALLPWAQWGMGISPFAGDALMVSYYLAGWGIAMVVGYNLAIGDTGQSKLAIMHMLWIAALLSACLGLTQWLKLEESLGIFAAQTDPGDPAMGNLAQPNQLSTLILMGIAAYAWVYERRVIGALAFAMGLVILTFALVLTHSRSGMVGVMVIGLFLIVRRSKNDTRIRTWQIASWMVLFALLSVASPFIDQALMLDVDREAVFTLNGRRLIWTQTWKGIVGAPWTGYGWNQTFSAISVGAAQYPGVLVATYAHNVFLDFLAWNGLPVGLFLIGLGGYWFCTRVYRVANTTGIYAMACLLPFLLHSLVELPFAYAYFLLTSGLLIGVVEASILLPDATARNGGTDRAAQREFWPQRIGWRYAVVVAFAIWVVAGVAVIYEYLLIEEDVRITRFENLRVGATEATYQPPQIRLLTHMGALQRATRLQPVPHMTESQLDDMRRAVRRFPSGGLALRYALAQGLNGDIAGAQHTLDLIRGVYGATYFAQAKVVWLEHAHKHPGLKEVKIGD